MNRVGARVAAVLGAVVLTLSGLSSCSNRSAADAYFIGDSITDQARDLLHQRFGVDDTHVIAVGGKTVQDMTVPAQELVAKGPKKVLVNLGTNDVLGLKSPDQVATQLDQLLRLYPGADCVLVVTVNEHMVSPQGGDPRDLAASVNQKIREWDGQGNRRVVDWAKTVLDYDAAKDPNGPITTDTVHPTPVGQQMLLDEYERALSRC